MNMNRRKVTRYLTAALAVMLLVVFTASAAFAELYIPENRVIYKDKDTTSYNIMLDGVSKTSAITKLKSSKKSVATVSKFVYGDTAYVAINMKKPGKTTVTFNVKYKGKTVKAKTKVEIRKYVNPFKSLKIGSKNYASKFKENPYCTLTKTAKGKMTIKLKSGYKIKGISTYNGNDGSGYKILKNKKNITIKKGYVLSISVLPKDAPDDEEPLTCTLHVE